MPVALERLSAVGPPPAGHGGTTAADLAEYADDLETVYGPLPDRGWLERGERVSYPDLVTAAADVLGGPDGGVDLLLTVTPVPDCQARVLPGCLLAELLGGRPQVVGVNDQGAAGVFTALRLARGRLAGGGARRAAVVVMEQSTLPPEPGYALPPGSGAAVLVLGTGAGPRLAELSVRRLPAAERRPERRSGGWLRPWYEAALRYAADPCGELAVADRDEALGYDCRVLFTPATPATPVEKAGTAGASSAAGAGGPAPGPDRPTTPFPRQSALEART